MIGVLSVTNAVSRFSVCSMSMFRNVSTHACPLYFRVTETLLGEPLKKKKKIDPGILRAREDRKKKKLEKRIRMLEKHASHRKPIFEIDGLAELLKDDSRVVGGSLPLPSSEEIERKSSLDREWCKYKKDEWIKDLRVMKSILKSRETALNELRAASEELYKEAVQLDTSYLPYSASGPLHTPPINNYDNPDGEYLETTIKYAGE